MKTKPKETTTKKTTAVKLASITLWLYSKWLAFFLKTMRFFMVKENYLNFLVGVAQSYGHLGKLVTLMAVDFAINNNIELGGDSTAEQESEPEPDEGPQLNVPPAVQAQLPVFRDHSGEELPFCFDPLPEYTIFEALFVARYGKFGKCPITIMGRPAIFSCSELYTLLDRIWKDPNPTPHMQAFYGSIMSIVVMRHGRTVNAETAN